MTAIADMVRALRPLQRAMRPLLRLARGLHPGTVPSRFVREADRLAARRHRAVTIPGAHALFAIAAWKYRLLRGDGERVRGPGGWRKRHCETYIRGCLRIARPLAGEDILFQAMGEAFGESTRTIERAWRDRPERRRRSR